MSGNMTNNCTGDIIFFFFLMWGSDKLNSELNILFIYPYRYVNKF